MTHVGLVEISLNFGKAWSQCLGDVSGDALYRLERLRTVLASRRKKLLLATVNQGRAHLEGGIQKPADVLRHRCSIEVNTVLLRVGVDRKLLSAGVHAICAPSSRRWDAGRCS